MKNMERRIVSGKGELRVVGGDGEAKRIVGHAAVFNELSEPLGGFRERISPGAFARAIREGQDVRGLFNHDSNLILGRTSAGTMKISEDDKGLAYEITPPDSDQARALVESIRRGDVTGNSFSFMTMTDKWETINGETIRTLIDVDLFDVGPVVWPAYPQTDVALRSLDRWKAESHGAGVDLLRRRLDLASA